MTRRKGIDIIKAIAAACVISVHHFNYIGFYDVPYNNGLTMIFGTALYLVTFVGVPLFLITSGYLLAKREINKDHYVKGIYFLVEVFLIYFFGYLIVLLVRNEFSINTWIYLSIKYFLQPSYYVGLYLSLYLVVPFLNKLSFSLDKKENIILMLVLIFVISLPKLLNLPSKIQFFDVRPTEIWSIMYYLIGVFIRKYNIKINKLINTIGIVSIGLLYAILINKFCLGSTYQNIFGYYENIFAVIMASLIFILVYDLDFKCTILEKILKIISSSTLTFYIFSGMFSDSKAWNHLNITGILYKDIFTIPAKVFFSMMYSLPLALLVMFIMNIIRKYSTKLMKFN